MFRLAFASTQTLNFPPAAPFASDSCTLCFAISLGDSAYDSMRKPRLRCSLLKNHIAMRREFELICGESAAKPPLRAKSSNISIKCYSQAPAAGEFFFTLNE